MQVARESFTGELVTYGRALRRFDLRWHLAKFPRDLVRHWWRVAGRMPAPTSDVAYRAWKAGEPARRRLYRGPSHFPQRPQLRVVGGTDA